MPKKKAETFAFVLIAAVAVFSLSFAGARMGTASREEAAGETRAENTTKAIAIPGYEVIPLKADQNEQSVTLYNPAANDCYFVVSLLLNEEELFTSELMAPGEELRNINLSQPLAAGVYYDARLKYQSFDLDNMTELNGAEVVTILEVKT